MEIVFVAALAGALLTGFVAQSKGRNFFGWFLYGALIWIIALPHALMLGRDNYALENRKISEGGKICPDCAEVVKRDARVCRFCGLRFATSEAYVDLPSGIVMSSGSPGVPATYWVGDQKYPSLDAAKQAISEDPIPPDARIVERGGAHIRYSIGDRNFATREDAERALRQAQKQ